MDYPASNGAQPMTRSVTLWLSALMFVVVSLGPACGADTSTAVVVKESDAGKSVPMTVGQELVVELPAQLGTGFSWSVDESSASIVKLVKSAQTGAAAPGQAETQRFVFTAAQVGSGTLSLSYRRPWEKDKPPSKVFAVSVRVASSAG